VLTALDYTPHPEPLFRPGDPVSVSFDTSRSYLLPRNSQKPAPSPAAELEAENIAESPNPDSISKLSSSRETRTDDSDSPMVTLQ
jgi:hypothetical protein